ncbi:MAG: response regulator [Candidatus Portnoybacteria bacterium]|nr:response regulator [Candidatus Portnoybacteria bacterium]
MKKILIIEDEKVLLEILQKKLTIQGYEVFVSYNGEEGIAALRKEKPDLVLLDLVMPKKDGFEVLKEINENPELSQIPVIIISNSGQPVEIDKALKMGVKDYLVKTEFDPEEVIAKVEKIIGKDAAITQAPVAPAVNQPAAGAVEKEEEPTGDQILIVEDDRFLRELIIQKLKGENYKIDWALDGEEGLKKIKEQKPALVLLDLILPGIDGFEVLRQIKKGEDASLSKIPVIILSNLGQRDDVERGMALGAEEFLVKAHFTPGEIVEKVKSVLGKK